MCAAHLAWVQRGTIVAGDMPAKTTYTDSHGVDAVANSQEWGRPGGGLDRVCVDQA